MVGPGRPVLTLRGLNSLNSQSCHRRMWRAHNEPPPGKFSPIASKTDERREHRTPCSCLLDGHGLDRYV